MWLAKTTTFFSLVLLIFANGTRGQTASGEVNGTVTDKSGGFVGSAAVKLTNQATGIDDRATTNSDGYFVFINVKPGMYVLGVEARGFKTTRISSFEVGVNQTVTQAVSLDVGAVNEQVVVSAETAMLEASTSELGTVIPEKAVNDLPLNGRNFTQLLTLTPGVTPVSTAQNKSIGCCEGNVGIPGSGFSDASFHGQQNRSKFYFFDGIINTNLRGPTYIVIPNIDQIQEFKVVGHDAKAEFGGATGGVLDMVSASGSGSFRGSGSARAPFRCDASGDPLPLLPGTNLQDQTLGAPCNKLPQALISAEMQQFFLKYSTLSNYSVATDLGHNFIQTRPTPNTSNSFQLRIDHRLSQKDNLFFRYTEQRVSVVNPIGEVGFTEGGSTGRNYGGSWVHIFRPSLVLDLRAGYAGRPAVDAGQQNQNPLGLDPLNQLGFKEIDNVSGILFRLNTNQV